MLLCGFGHSWGLPARPGAVPIPVSSSDLTLSTSALLSVVPLLQSWNPLLASTIADRQHDMTKRLGFDWSLMLCGWLGWLSNVHSVRTYPLLVAGLSAVLAVGYGSVALRARELPLEAIYARKGQAQSTTEEEDKFEPARAKVEIEAEVEAGTRGRDWRGPVRLGLALFLGLVAASFAYRTTVTLISVYKPEWYNIYQYIKGSYTTRMVDGVQVDSDVVWETIDPIVREGWWARQDERLRLTGV